MAGYSTEVLSVLYEKQEVKIQGLYEEVRSIREIIERRERERLQQERSLAIRGLIALGTIVSVLGGVIWQYRAVIFKG